MYVFVHEIQLSNKLCWTQNGQNTIGSHMIYSIPLNHVNSKLLGPVFTSNYQLFKLLGVSLTLNDIFYIHQMIVFSISNQKICFGFLKERSRWTQNVYFDSSKYLLI